MSKIMILFFATIFIATFVSSSTTEIEKTSETSSFSSSLHQEVNKLAKANRQLVETDPVIKWEDLMAAENVVHRPLFVHRKRLVRSRGLDERHIYSDNYRNYPQPYYPEYRSRRLYSTSWNYPSYYKAPVQVKRRLRRPSIAEAEFPVLI